MALTTNYSNLVNNIPVVENFLYTWILKPIITSRLLINIATIFSSKTAGKIKFVLDQYEHRYKKRFHFHSTIHGGDSVQKLTDLLSEAQRNSPNRRTLIDFRKQYSLDSAIAEQQRNPSVSKIAILNCANRTNVGGVWRYFNGGSQEEDLFRTSDLEWYLNPDRNTALKNEIKLKLDFTMGRHHIPYYGATFSRGVEFIQGKTYSFNVLSAAAIDLRSWSTEKKYFDRCPGTKEQIRLTTLAKIDAIFATAAVEKQDVLILAAIGCGAFQNDKDTIAECYKTICDKYNGKFEKIVFCLPDPKVHAAFEKAFKI